MSSGGEDTTAPARVLPGFDNVLAPSLLVLPALLVDGFVAGTWTMTATRQLATLAMTPFVPLTKQVQAELAQEAEQLVRFLEPAAKSHAVV